MINNSIEHLFDNYLEKAGLNKANLHLIQLQETKRAFVAGMATAMKILDALAESELDEAEAVGVLYHTRRSIDEFFKGELSKLN